MSEMAYALAWMAGTLASFCLMAVGARELSGELTIYQTLFFRSVIGLLCLSMIILFSKEKISVKTERFGLHTFRNLFHFVGQYGWFVGIGILPLAEVFALEFTVPIWTLALAAITLGEKITKQKLLSLFLGMLGVLVIVQPGYGIIQPASLIVLSAALCFAVSHTATKALSSSDSAISILFYMCLVQLPIGFALSLARWSWPVGVQWFWLVIVGGTALSAHFCMAKAMKHTEVTKIVTIDFLRLPLITLVGIILYAEPFEFALMLGGALMLAGNLVNIRHVLRPMRDNATNRPAPVSQPAGSADSKVNETS